MKLLRSAVTAIFPRGGRFAAAGVTHIQIWTLRVQCNAWSFITMCLGMRCIPVPELNGWMDVPDGNVSSLDPIFDAWCE